MKRVLQAGYFQRAVEGGNTAIDLVRKTLRSLRKKAVLVIRTARLSRKDIIERAVSTVNMGGIAEACLSSQIVGRKAFLFFVCIIFIYVKK